MYNIRTAVVFFLCHTIAVVRPHRMHQMQTIVTNDPGVCLLVCLSESSGSTQLHCAKTAERIKMVFAVNTLGGPRNIVLVGVS